jgi:hypothetical protein
MKSKRNKGDHNEARGTTRRPRQPGFKSPNFHALRRMPMAVAFIFPDGEVRPLQGICRGDGAITGTERPYEATIGIYTAEGDHHNIKVDLRIKCAVPTFVIGRKAFYCPVVKCYTMGVKVDPNTGIMI